MLGLLWGAFVVASGVSVAAETGSPSQVPAKPPIAVPSPRIGAAAFAQLPFVEQARISPSGTRFAGLLAIHGQQVIAIRDLFDAKKKQVVIGIPDGTELSWIQWVNEENILIRVHALMPVIGGERWYISRVFAINSATGKITKIFGDSAGQDAADVIWIPSDGSNQILLAAQNSIFTNYEEFWPAVYSVDVSNGRKSKVLRGRQNVMSWITDSAGKIRAGIFYDDLHRNFAMLYRGERETGPFHMVVRADTRKREELVTPFLFEPGTERAFAMHDDDNGRTAIYEQDLTTLKDLRLVYSAPEGEVDDVILSEDGKALLGATTTADDGRIHWFDPALAELQGHFDKAVPDARVSIESMNRDRTRMLVRVSAPDMAGSIYYYDVNGGRLQKIATVNEALGGRRLAPVKVIHYAARDGLGIEGMLTLPKDRDPHNLPFIVMPHGGPWARDGLVYDYWAQFLADMGYAVLQPNFRGSTGYGTEFLRRGEGQLGLAMQDDVTDGVQWAVKQGLADPKRVCIVGASYGGYAAMWGIAREPDLYRCAISIAGVANLRREVNDFGHYLMKGKFQDDWKRMTPDFAAVSPYNAVDRINTPLLLIHGKKDVTVDHGQSVRMYGRMREAGKDVEFVSLPLADHYYTREADRLGLLGAMEQFLAKHNPAN
jgi:dipeptidyl aminopeptidase/acylaminoacyl peptidase